MGFVECLELFLADPDTDGVILLGEIGGTGEEEAADFLRQAKTSKRIVAYVAGRHAPTHRRMGHAGTVTVFGRGEADAKIEALAAAGAHMAPNAAVIGTTMKQVLS
jgi:succinyl-CoA synthetase alpha subunit